MRESRQLGFQFFPARMHPRCHIILCLAAYLFRTAVFSFVFSSRYPAPGFSNGVGRTSATTLQGRQSLLSIGDRIIAPNIGFPSCNQIRSCTEDSELNSHCRALCEALIIDPDNTPSGVTPLLVPYSRDQKLCDVSLRGQDLADCVLRRINAIVMTGCSFSLPCSLPLRPSETPKTIETIIASIPKKVEDLPRRNLEDRARPAAVKGQKPLPTLYPVHVFEKIPVRASLSDTPEGKRGFYSGVVSSALPQKPVLTTIKTLKPQRASVDIIMPPPKSAIDEVDFPLPSQRFETPSKTATHVSPESPELRLDSNPSQTPAAARLVPPPLVRRVSAPEPPIAVPPIPQTVVSSVIPESPAALPPKTASTPLRSSAASHTLGQEAVYIPSTEAAIAASPAATAPLRTAYPEPAPLSPSSSIHPSAPEAYPVPSKPVSSKKKWALPVITGLTSFGGALGGAYLGHKVFGAKTSSPSSAASTALVIPPQPPVIPDTLTPGVEQQSAVTTHHYWLIFIVVAITALAVAIIAVGRQVIKKKREKFPEKLGTYEEYEDWVDDEELDRRKRGSRLEESNGDIPETYSQKSGEREQLITDSSAFYAHSQTVVPSTSSWKYLISAWTGIQPVSQPEVAAREFSRRGERTAPEPSATASLQDASKLLASPGTSHEDVSFPHHDDDPFDAHDIRETIVSIREGPSSSMPSSSTQRYAASPNSSPKDGNE